jgi:hypothetical protein
LGAWRWPGAVFFDIGRVHSPTLKKLWCDKGAGRNCERRETFKALKRCNVQYEGAGNPTPFKAIQGNSR